jgi:hypothetical protein
MRIFDSAETDVQLIVHRKPILIVSRHPHLDL